MIDQRYDLAPPPPRRPTDGVSVAALVTGVLGLGLVPTVLGGLGLHRTRGGRRAGRGWCWGSCSCSPPRCSSSCW